MPEGKLYNQPPGTPSSIGPQMNEFFYHKRALIEAQREQFFMPLADVKPMPKHFGKSMKLYHYMPLLDDRNVNDQGIDATGATITDGNLYGSSRDIGTIPGKMPVLSETGGRVNRVGFKRLEIEGSIEKFGFFEEYSQESVDFDSDPEMRMHVSREMVTGASKITEDLLQVDLLSSAGVIKWSGDATELAEVDSADTVTYGDLIRLGIELDNNRTPKQTRVITGTRNIDTRVIPGARVMYVGPELLPHLMSLKDFHDEKAFIEVQHYAAAGNTLNGEAGSIGPFRVVVVQEMMKYAGAGDDVGAVEDFHETDGNFDVFPMLVVGDGSFSTIGFQTDGKTVKFKIIHRKPGEDTADRHEPFGEMGFMSIKWYYGFLLLRPERLAIQYTAAML